MEKYEIKRQISQTWNLFSWAGKPFAILCIAGFLLMVLLDECFIN